MSVNENQETPAGYVRLQYTGQNVGSIDFTHPQSGQAYQGGNNSRDLYQDVPDSDVAWLLGTGRFARVEIPADATQTLAQKDAALAKQQADAAKSQKEADDAAAAALAKQQADDAAAAKKPSK